jgi:uncharacterized protein (UPF0332 family)
MAAPIGRARDELAAAHVLAVSGLTAQSVAVAFRGALQGAEAALLLLDRVPPAGDAAVVAAFLRHVVRERGLDAEAGRRLRLLLNRHQLAEVGAPPPEEAHAALDDARHVIDVVAAWIEVSLQVAEERGR